MRELVPTGSIGQEKSKNTSYKVSISTADVENAGTRDNIKLILTGEDGETELRLRNSIGLKRADSRDFEAVNSQNIGVIKEVSVSLENTRLRDKTFITIIQVIAEGTTYIAPVDDWVSLDPVKVNATMESGLGNCFIIRKTVGFLSIFFPTP